MYFGIQFLYKYIYIQLDIRHIDIRKGTYLKEINAYVNLARKSANKREVYEFKANTLLKILIFNYSYIKIIFKSENVQYSIT